MSILAACQIQLAKENIDRLVVTDENNLLYLLQQPVDGILVLTPDTAHFYTTRFFRYTDLTVDTNICTAQDLRKIVGELPEPLYADQQLETRDATVTDILTRQRAVKRSDELQKIQKACEISDKAMQVAYTHLKPGITPWDIASHIDQTIRSHGCYNAFDTLVQRNATEPHGWPSNTPIQETDFVIVDLGARYRGYCADMTRTFCLNPTEKQQRLFEAVKQAQSKAIQHLQNGTDLRQLQEQTNNMLARTLRPYGITEEESVLHALGHGVGIAVHERPFFHSSTTVQAGQVLAIEPGMYHPSFGGIRIEDTVHISTTPHMLTQYPQRLS